MIWKFKPYMMLIGICIMLSAIQANAEEKTKEFYQSWSVNAVQSLEIENKFGEVKIVNERTDSVSIEVVVTVEARDEKKADDLLDLIEVEFRKSGSIAKAVTEIKSNFKSQREFSIDYLVNIPSDKNLKITNKYGDTFVNELKGEGDFRISYGSLNANKLMGDQTRIDLAYGKSNVEQASDLEINVKYSGMVFGEVGNVKIESKYSGLEIEEGKDILIESKYDKFTFAEVEAITATTKYSHIRIEELARKLEVEAGYGSIKVAHINDRFESISITNSYGKISLGVEAGSYAIDAACQYCGIDYPEDEFVGDRIKENNSRKIKGMIGSGGNGKIYIRSRYGDISLKD